MFNENTLRAEIISACGLTSPHVKIFDEILRTAKANIFAWPITIKVVPKKVVPTGVIENSVEIKSSTRILNNRNKWYLIVGPGDYEIPKEEIARLWPIIEFTDIIGKKGAYFNIKKK